MTDIVDSATRSRMMSGIKGKDTKPELAVRQALFRKGLRYTLHRKDLPGRPDLVFPKYRTVLFVNGCFWHAHRCTLFKWPSSNIEFWRDKVEKNAARDAKNHALLRERGWQVIILWECEFKRKSAKDFDSYIDTVVELVHGM